MSEEHLVEDWCFELGLENEGWLDKGEFGNAYTISDEKVIKMTSDHNEFIQTFNILKKESDYLPEVFGMRIFPNGEMGILMEELGTDGIEDLFASLQMEAELQGVDLLDVELEGSFLPDDVIKLAKDLSNSVFHFQNEGVAHFDIHERNIGINSKGNYVLFDQTNKNTKEYNEDLLEDIKEKLLDQYSIEETIYKENVPLNRISANRNSLTSSLRHISNNKVSETEGAVECMYNEYGDLQIVDGYHRLCEALLKGEESIDVEIGLDERYGYSHPVYALLHKDDALEIDTDLTFGGLEDIADEETLGDYYENYVKYKESIKKQKSKKSLKI